jgi:hypothetical protein
VSNPGKKHVPTADNRKTVEAMAAYGITEEDIARVIDVSEPTLRKYYPNELDLGRVKANAKVAERLFQIATGSGREAVTACIFWLKVRAGWSEYSAASFMGPAPKPLGKKEQANIAAVEAKHGTEWGHLVN